MKKKVSLIMLGVVIFTSLVVITYSEKYIVEDDKTQLEENIKLFINRPSIVVNNIDIKQKIDIGNKKYVLFTANSNLGDAELSKGFNNKYKIESAGYGSNFFRYYIYKNNNSKFLIVGGKNYDMKIAYMKISLDNKEYKINIQHEEYFLAYCTISDEMESTIPDINKFKLYDKNNIDITEEMFEKFIK